MIYLTNSETSIHTVMKKNRNKSKYKVKRVFYPPILSHTCFRDWQHKISKQAGLDCSMITEFEDQELNIWKCISNLDPLEQNYIQPIYDNSYFQIWKDNMMEDIPMELLYDLHRQHLIR